MSSTYPSKTNIERMRSLYGENKTISDSFDLRLAVKCHNGTFVGKKKDNVLCFKGIPFAKPPINELRWKAPVEVSDSDEVREAYYFGKSAIQAPWYSELASCYPQSEDCLYLNIWANENTNDKKAVMVFIHGGAYGYGGTSDPMYDGFNFVKAHPDIVLVTIAYRVGVMGFIDFSMIKGSECYEDSPNLGILDQIMALNWINKNISGFGGDKDNVTIFGESAGGGSVSILPLIDSAKGLFRRVIAQSGSISLTYSKNECEYFTRLFQKQTNAKTMEDFLNLSTEQIYNANQPINEKNNFPMRDGKLLPINLYKEYKNGKTKDIDMLAGTNKDECRYWIGELGGKFSYSFLIPILYENQCKLFNKEDKRLAKSYYEHGEGATYSRLTEFENDIAFRVPAQEQLLLHSDNGGKAYHYFYTYESSVKDRGACHAVELSAIFNNPQETIYTGGRYDEKLASIVQSMWVNFAKTGNPSTKDYIWEEYKRDNKKTMVLGEKIYVKENLYSRRTALIENLLKYELNGNYAELDFNVRYVRFLVYCLIGFIILVVLTLFARRFL